MILVDSSVWIDYFNGNQTSQADWLDSSLGNTPRRYYWNFLHPKPANTFTLRP